MTTRQFLHRAVEAVWQALQDSGLSDPEVAATLRLRDYRGNCPNPPAHQPAGQADRWHYGQD